MPSPESTRGASCLGASDARMTDNSVMIGMPAQVGRSFSGQICHQAVRKTAPHRHKRTCIRHAKRSCALGAQIANYTGDRDGYGGFCDCDARSLQGYRIFPHVRIYRRVRSTGLRVDPRGKISYNATPREELFESLLSGVS